MNHNIYPTKHLANLEKHGDEKIIKVVGGYAIVSTWYSERMSHRKPRKSA